MAVALAAPASADVLVSNIAQPPGLNQVSLEPNPPGTNTQISQAFTTGSHPTGYTLASVEVKFGSAPPSSVRVRILDTTLDLLGRPGVPGTTTVARLTNPASLAAGNLTFSAPAGTTLEAGTTYALAVDTARYGTLGTTDVTTETGEPDWSVADIYFFKSTLLIGTHVSLQIRVNGTANPLVSNTGQTRSSAARVGFDGANNWEMAVSFTTGPSEAGYTLSAVDAFLTSLSSASPNVSIHTTSSGVPDSRRHALNNPTSVTGEAVNTFTATAGATLDPNTTYAVVFQQTGTSGSYSVGETASTVEDAATGWGIADTGQRKDAASATGAWAPNVRTVMIGVKGRAADTTPPALVSALVNGNKLTLTFDEALGAAARLANGAFRVKKAGAGDTDIDVNLSTSKAPSVSGKTVVLTLASVIGSADRGFKVSYTRPAGGTATRIVNAAGIAAGSFSEQVAPRSLVSNLGQTAGPGQAGIDIDHAQPFRTGSNAGGYRLTHVSIRLQRTSATATPTYAVSIHEDGAMGDTPGDRLRTLDSPASLPTTDTNVDFIAAAGLDLSANTTYWLVWNTSAQNSSAGHLRLTGSTGEDAGAATGWTVSNGSKSRSFSATTWPSAFAASVYRIAVYGHIRRAPMVTDVRISSTPSHDVDGNGTPETYGPGQKVQVRVTLDKKVTVDTTGGTPRLMIKMATSSAERWADYEGGGGTTVLTFGYEVVATDRSTQGIAVPANTLQVNGGAIRAADDATLDTDLTHAARPHDLAHKVDGSLPRDETAPAFAGATVNRATLVVTFDEALDPVSAPTGSAFRVSGGRTGTGTATLSGATATVTLDAAVAPDEQMVTVSYRSPGTGNNPLRDGSGNDVQSFTGKPVTNNTPGSTRPRPPDGGSGGGGGGGPPNRAPVATADIERPVLDVGQTIEIDATRHFRDPEGDDLSFSATSADDTIVSVTVDGSTIRIEGLRHGVTAVTVTARDTRRGTATQEFSVSVGWLAGFGESRVAVPEGDSITLEVALNRERETDTVVRYVVQADDDPETENADADDHDAVDGAITIPAGETVASLEVTIHDDEDIEPVWEVFALALQRPLVEPLEYDLSIAVVTVTVEEGVCDRTKAIRDGIRRSLPCANVDPEDMASVRTLSLRDHGITALQPGDLLGLHALRFLDLNGNALEELPGGLFSGLTSLAEVDLAENPGAPFNLVVGLSRTDAELPAPGPATVVATVAEGAPFDMEGALKATDSTLPNSMTITRGSLSGAPLTVQHAGAVRMEIAPPPVPADDACGDVVPVPCYRGLTTSAGPPIVLFREPPEATGTPPAPEIVTNEETRIDLSALAAASDGGALTFAAYSSDTSLLLVHVEGSVLTIASGDGEGTATVTVIATDAEGLTVAIELNVRVEFASRGLLRGARGVLLTEPARPADE